MDQFPLGVKPVVRASFDPGPPTTYHVYTRDPAGTEVELTEDVTIEGEDVVVRLPVCTVAGVWTTRVIGTAGAVGAREAQFYVMPSPILTAIPVGE